MQKLRAPERETTFQDPEKGTQTVDHRRREACATSTTAAHPLAKSVLLIKFCLTTTDMIQVYGNVRRLLPALRCGRGTNVTPACHRVLPCAIRTVGARPNLIVPLILAFRRVLRYALQ